MHRLMKVSILLLLLVSLQNPQEAFSQNPAPESQDAPTPVGRLVVFEGFMRAT